MLSVLHPNIFQFHRVSGMPLLLRDKYWKLDTVCIPSASFPRSKNMYLLDNQDTYTYLELPQVVLCLVDKPHTHTNEGNFLLCILHSDNCTLFQMDKF